MKITADTLPPFGDPRISYEYIHDESTPAEPSLTDDNGDQIPDDAQAILIDGVIVFSIDAPWCIEQGHTIRKTDRELYDLYCESLEQQSVEEPTGLA